jgi:hypothetical protein
VSPKIWRTTKPLLTLFINIEQSQALQKVKNAMLNVKIMSSVAVELVIQSIDVILCNSRWFLFFLHNKFFFVNLKKKGWLIFWKVKKKKRLVFSYFFLFFFHFLFSYYLTAMTSMDVSLSYPVSKFEADNSLTNPEVIEKYQLAADIVNGKKI